MRQELGDLVPIVVNQDVAKVVPRRGLSVRPWTQAGLSSECQTRTAAVAPM